MAEYPSTKKTTSKKSTADTKTKSSGSAPKKETYTVSSKDMIETIKRIVREGNTRRISVQNKKGKTLIVIPVTIGFVVTVLAPYVTLLAGLAAMLSEVTIVVERE